MQCTRACSRSRALPVCRQVASGKPLVGWNLELDTLRGDLGLLGYPPKELHYRWAARPCARTRRQRRAHTEAATVARLPGCTHRIATAGACTHARGQARALAAAAAAAVPRLHALALFCRALAALHHPGSCRACVRSSSCARATTPSRSPSLPSSSTTAARCSGSTRDRGRCGLMLVVAACACMRLRRRWCPPALRRQHAAQRHRRCRPPPPLLVAQHNAHHFPRSPARCC